MKILEILAPIVIVGYVIIRQLMGEPLRGKRLILLPAILAIIGVIDLGQHGHQPGATDIVMIAIGAVIAALIGLGQGSMMRLESRNGTLWGQMPVRSLWWWLGLVVSHGVLELVSAGIGAHVAASTAPILLALGLNRLAQAAVVAPRALAAGIPFAPEKDGSTFLSGTFGPRSPQQAQPYPGSDTYPPQQTGWYHADRSRPGDGPLGGGLQAVLSLILERLEQRGPRRG